VYNAAVARGLKSGDLLQLFLLIHVHISFILKIIHSKNVVFDYFNVVLPNFQRNFVCLVVLCLLWLTQKHQPQRHHNLLVVRDHSFTSDQASRRHCARTGAARTRGEGEYRGGEGWGNGKRIEWL
jgi:hypothetical protein